MNARQMSACLLWSSLVLLGACRDAQTAAVDPPLQPGVGVESPAPMPTPAMTPSTKDGLGVIDFDGFGPAKFGDNEEAVRMSWGRPLVMAGAEPQACRQLFVDPRPAEGFAISFMLVDSRFARVDVDSNRYVAPGGGQVGGSADELMLRYAGRIEVTPHKYVDGATVLTVAPVGGGAARLIFEISPQGQVTRWRIGMPPAVHYVEGCA